MHVVLLVMVMEHAGEINELYKKKGRCTYDADYICRFKSWGVTPCSCVSVS
jgi:hypothetical protein